MTRDSYTIQRFLHFINKVDYDLDQGYLKEVIEVKKWLLHDFNSISNENRKQKSSLDAKQVMNASTMQASSSVFGVPK